MPNKITTYLSVSALITGLLCAGALAADTPAQPAVSPAAETVSQVVPAGKLGSLRGKVWVQGNLVKDGDPIYAGSEIKTGTDSKATIRFSDDSMFALGPNSQMAVNDFRYRQNAEDNTISTNIFKGTFRFVSGLIAKKKPTSMNVKLGSVATIGIRGTHVAGEVTERSEQEGKVTEASAQVILMEPEDDPAKPTAILVSNDYGSVMVDKPGYGTEIPDEHSPPSPVRKMQVRTIENITRALRNATPKSIPRVP
ncbi:MAG TPA: FecR domain-containing protein [Gammaproteobacteria bacterium]